MSMANGYSQRNYLSKGKMQLPYIPLGIVIEGMTTGDRIAALRSELGLPQAALARAVGVRQGTIAKLETGHSAGSAHLHKIARVLQTSPAYLACETDDRSEHFVPAPTAAEVAEEMGIVGLYQLDLELGMGATYLDVPVAGKARYFDREWLAEHTNAKPEDLIFAKGVGDSMEPTIKDSDLLLIDCSRKMITMTDKIWAVAYANCGAVKRLRPRADGGVEMISDNENVPNDTAYDGEMTVLGRVVAIVRKM